MTALDRMLDPLSDCLDDEVARRIIALRIAPDIQARIEELADRCNEGQLTEAERAEYDGYVEGAEIVSLIKLKARRFLMDRGSNGGMQPPGSSSASARATGEGTMATETQGQYPHLEARPGSNYRQLFLKGRRIRAEVMYHAVHGPEPRTPEEVARDFEVPLEAVLEAVDYVERNPAIIQADREREEAKLRARGLLDGPPPT
jgi:hypothetical protein